MVDYGEIILRLTLATVAGGAIGLNRDLHGKPTGVRTLGLVEVLFAQAISSFVFKQPTSRREAAGIVMVVIGVALLVWARA